MKMSIGPLLASVAAALSIGAVAVASFPAQAADPVNIRIGWPSPLVGPHGTGAKAFSEEVERLAPGRFKTQFFPSGALGGEREMVESVQLGTLEMAITGTAVIGNFLPDMLVLDLPFLFKDSAHARATLDGPVGQELLAKMRSRQLIGLTFGEIGFRHVTTSNKAVNAPDDLKGLKIRTMENPVHLAAFRALGALPTPMAWTEVLTGLQQGVIDGQENPISILVSAKMWETQKHVTLTRHVFTPIAFTMSAEFFGKLSPADQEVMRKASLVARDANRKYVDDVDGTGIKELKSHGVAVIENVDASAFQKRLEPVYQQYGKRFGPILDRIAAEK